MNDALAIISICAALWLALHLAEEWYAAGDYVDEQVAKAAHPSTQTVEIRPDTSDLERCLAEAIALTRTESIGDEAERWLRSLA